MPDNINKNVLLVGAGQMAIDYFKVLQSLNYNVTVIGRSASSAEKFFAAVGVEVITGGLETFLKSNNQKFDFGIIAVGVEALSEAAILLLKHNISNILVEKPGALTLEQIKSIQKLKNEKSANIFIAYNRRFFASTIKAQQIILEDEGVKSFLFEFTEWNHLIKDLTKAEGIKENWLLANSTHVIDLAFYLGGEPQELSSFSAGKLTWHPKSIFSGAGISKTGALFSYHANWEAPGRWGVEICTTKHRLIFRPMESLHIQNIGSVAITQVEIDDQLDKKFKPGLYMQTKAFLEKNNSNLCTLDEQVNNFMYYKKISGV